MQFPHLHQLANQIREFHHQLVNIIQRSNRRSAGGAEQLPALSPALAAGTPNSMLRAAAARYDPLCVLAHSRTVPSACTSCVLPDLKDRLHTLKRRQSAITWHFDMALLAISLVARLRRQHESARRGSGVSVHFTSPVAGAAAPTATPVTGALTRTSSDLCGAGMNGDSNGCRCSCNPQHVRDLLYLQLQDSKSPQDSYVTPQLDCVALPPGVSAC